MGGIMKLSSFFSQWQFCKLEFWPLLHVCVACFRIELQFTKLELFEICRIHCLLWVSSEKRLTLKKAGQNGIMTVMRKISKYALGLETMHGLSLKLQGEKSCTWFLKMPMRPFFMPLMLFRSSATGTAMEPSPWIKNFGLHIWSNFSRMMCEIINIPCFYHLLGEQMQGTGAPSLYITLTSLWHGKSWSL